MYYFGAKNDWLKVWVSLRDVPPPFGACVLSWDSPIFGCCVCDLVFLADCCMSITKMLAMIPSIGIAARSMAPVEVH